MSRLPIEETREKIRLSQYDMTMHAMEEMAEDSREIVDIEQAILGGQVVRIEKDDPRVNRYVIEGIASNNLTPVGVVDRFTSHGRNLIITVYEIIDL